MIINILENINLQTILFLVIPILFNIYNKYVNYSWKKASKCWNTFVIYLDKFYVKNKYYIYFFSWCFIINIGFTFFLWDLAFKSLTRIEIINEIDMLKALVQQIIILILFKLNLYYTRIIFLKTMTKIHFWLLSHAEFYRINHQLFYQEKLLRYYEKKAKLTLVERVINKIITMLIKNFMGIYLYSFWLHFLIYIIIMVYEIIISKQLYYSYSYSFILLFMFLCRLLKNFYVKRNLNNDILISDYLYKNSSSYTKQRKKVSQINKAESKQNFQLSMQYSKIFYYLQKGLRKQQNCIKRFDMTQFTIYVLLFYIITVTYILLFQHFSITWNLFNYKIIFSDIILFFPLFLMLIIFYYLYSKKNYCRFYQCIFILLSLFQLLIFFLLFKPYIFHSSNIFDIKGFTLIKFLTLHEKSYFVKSYLKFLLKNEVITFQDYNILKNKMLNDISFFINEKEIEHLFDKIKAEVDRLKIIQKYLKIKLNTKCINHLINRLKQNSRSKKVLSKTITTIKNIIITHIISSSFIKYIFFFGCKQLDVFLYSIRNQLAYANNDNILKMILLKLFPSNYIKDDMSFIRRFYQTLKKLL